MNKSTPIAQLPTMNQQGSFINDQQRQMITNAQAAIQQSTMPQNTQLSSDIINDDDPAIQEVLSQFNGGGPSSKQEQMNNMNMVQQNHMQQQQMLAQLQAQQNYMENMAQMNQLPPQMTASIPQIVPGSSAISTEVLKSYIVDISDDLTLTGLVLGLFVVVHFIPIENIITRYISLDKIPYHSIIIKAIFAAILFFFIKKLII